MTNKVTISTKKQLRTIKNELTKKASVNTLKIVVNKKVTWEVTAAPRNLLSVETKEGLVTNGIAEFTIDNFTDDMISVEFRGRNKEILEKSKLFYTTAIKIAGKNSDVISIRKINNKTHGYSLVSKKGGVVDIRELIKKGYRLYVAGPYSASEARKKSTTLYKTNSSKEFASKLNELTYGAYEVLEDSEMTLEQLQKAAARMGQWKTGMTHTEDCELVAAYYIDKWKIDITQYGDGKAYLRDVKVAQVLSNEKYKIERNAVEGLLIQNRPFSVCKTLSKVTNEKYIKSKILFDAKANDDNIIWINREEVTKEIQEEFNKLFIKGETSTFRGKVVIIKPKEVKPYLKNIDFYTDLNGLKASYDLTRDSGLNILAIDKPLNKAVANTNTQQLETFAMADPEGTKAIVINLAQVYNKKLFHEALTPKVKAPSIKEVEQMYTAGIVKSIAPKFALQNEKVFGAIADQAVQGMVKRVQGLNYQVPGQSRILQMDFGAEFGVRILEPGTCFVPGIKEKWILGTRNPKQYSGEFLLLKNMSISEINALIKEKVQDKRLQNLLTREYRLLSDSAVVIAAYEEYKDTIGGADVDGDTLTLVFHRKLTAVIKKDGRIKSTAIQVKNKSQKQEKDKMFGLRSIHTAFVELITNGNLSIGEVTYMNNFFLGLLFDLMNGNSAAALEFFKFAGNEGSGVAEYVARPRFYNKELKMNTISVSFEILEKMIQDIKEMELTPANMIAALDDLNAAFMMLQMETIDAAKKGTKVPVPYEGLLNVFQQASKTKVDIDFGIRKRDDIDESYKVFDGVKYSIETRNGWSQESVDKNGEPIMRYIHQDLFHEIRIDIARDIMRIARVLRKRYEKTRYSEDIANHFITAKDQAGEKLVRDLIELKKMYNTINAGIREDVTEEPHYKIYMEALANTVRLITSHMSDVERAELAEAISMPSSNISSHSSFALNTLKEEFIKMAVEYFAEIDVAGEPLMVRKNVEEGDVLSFNFGVAKDGDKLAATRADISGEFVIRKINDRYYATKNIVDLIPKVEMNNKIIFRADVSANPHAVKEALLNAENVELKIEFGKGNLIVADGKVVGKFITSSGFGPLNRLYQDNNGVIERIMIVQERMNNGDMKDVLIAVLNCDSTPVVSEAEAKNKTIEDIAIENMNATESNEEDLF